MLSFFFSPVKNLFRIICLLSVTLALFCVYLLFSPQGARTAFQIISASTPYKISANKFTGNLASQLTLEQVNFNSPTLSFEANTLSAHWTLSEILQKQPILSYLTADTAKISLKNAKPLQSKLGFSISHLSLNNATIYWQKHIEKINKLVIKQSHDKHSNNSIYSHLESIYYQGTFGTVDAKYHKGLNVHWDLYFPAETPLPFTHIIVSQLKSQGTLFLAHPDMADFKHPNNKIKAIFRAKKISFNHQHFKEIDIDLKGTLASHQLALKAQVQQTAVVAHITGQATVESLNWNVKKLEISNHIGRKLSPITGNLRAHWNKARVQTQFALKLNKNIPVNFEAQFSPVAPYPVSGLLTAQVDNLRALSELVPSFTTLGGKLDVHLALNGKLFQPLWTGHVALTQAKFKAAPLTNKATLEKCQLNLLAQDKMTLEGQGTWGSGVFSLTGQGNLGSDPQLSVQFKGKDLLVSNTSEYYIVADPSLLFTVTPKKSLLQGKIFIPQAEINSIKSPDKMTPSEDVVLISQNQKNNNLKNKHLKKNLSSPKLSTHIELVLGDKVKYKGYGFTSEVKGKLEISQSDGQPPLAKGKFIFEKGKYRAYGKTFDIQNGQMGFTGGPLYDPILNIRAERVIQPASSFTTMQSATPITVGIKFFGNLKSPHIAFYSTPSMSDADIISYLVVNRPQSDVNNAQAELLFEAVSQLARVAGKSRNDVNFSLSEKLKLDQLSFTKKESLIAKSHSNPLEDTVLTLGKQLSDKLYLHYSIGLAESSSQFGMRYFLSKNLTLEATAGSQASGADLLLSFDGH